MAFVLARSSDLPGNASQRKEAQGRSLTLRYLSGIHYLKGKDMNDIGRGSLPRGGIAGAGRIKGKADVGQGENMNSP